jgi:aspartokinase-like uncharacterized kinase
MSGSVVVVKVGGSLLDWPDFRSRLSGYLETRSSDRVVLIVGGGRFADVLRELDSNWNLGEERSHQAALRVLDFTAHLVGAILPGAFVIDDLSSLDDAWRIGRIPILAPRRFLDDDDRSADPLPHHWSTTTDSIAARLAVRLQAQEVVLLKSVDIPDGMNPDQAARLGHVDPEFPRAVVGVNRVTYVNLRTWNESHFKGTDHRST